MSTAADEFLSIRDNPMDNRTAIHTMNNHLMVILGNLELLSTEISDPALQVSVEDAMTATEKAIDLVDDLRH